MDLERDGDKITGRSKKRFPFLFAISRSQSLMRLVRELTVALPPAKMSVSSVVFCSFVKVLLLFYNGTLNSSERKIQIRYLVTVTLNFLPLVHVFHINVFLPTLVSDLKRNFDKLM